MIISFFPVSFFDCLFVCPRLKIKYYNIGGDFRLYRRRVVTNSLSGG